jgi:foldase protein PrsA
MRRIVSLSFCAALLLLVVACGSGGSKDVPAGAVAVVGDSEITKTSWDAVIAQTRRNFKATKRAFPKAGSVELANLKSNATQFLIQVSEYEQEAEKLGVKVTAKDVDDRLAQIKKQYYGNPAGQKQATAAQIEKRYQEALKQQGFTDQEVRDGIRLALLREKVTKKVTDDVKVSDDEAREYYNDHKEQYKTLRQPESRDVRHILVKKKALADSLYTQLKAKPSRFASLAKKYSTDGASKDNGGRLPAGSVLKGRLDPAFEKVAFSIKTNAISKPVKTQFGWHIIQALGPVQPAVPPKATPFSQVKEAIRQQLLSKKNQDEMADWLKDVRSSYCKRIAYRQGYGPQPGQDPCQRSTTTTSATTTG